MKIKTNSKTVVSIAPFHFKEMVQIELSQNNIDYELPQGCFCVNNSAGDGNAQYIALAYYDADNNRNYIQPFFCASLQNGKLVAFEYNDLSTMIVINNITKICAYEMLNLGQQYVNCYKVGD